MQPCFHYFAFAQAPVGMEEGCLGKAQIRCMSFVVVVATPSLNVCYAQAMDRCHRIGQQKPVLVFRLATALSVEGKLLRRANSKLALERLVIKKGAFLPGQVCRASCSMLRRLTDKISGRLLVPGWLHLCSALLQLLV